MKSVDAEEDEVNSHPVNKNAPEKIKSGFSFPSTFQEQKKSSCWKNQNGKVVHLSDNTEDDELVNSIGVCRQIQLLGNGSKVGDKRYISFFIPLRTNPIGSSRMNFVANL